MDIFDFQSPEDPDSVMPYFHTTGAHTNAGGHRIPDVAEAMLSNASRFLDFYNFTHNEKNNATGLWNDYAWSIAYYFSIKLHEEWDEVYHNLESNPVYWIEGYNLAEAHNESTGENASKYLSTQYNPLVVENTPPVVVKFTVKWRIVVSLNPPKTSVYANVTVLVRDVGGIAYLRVLDENNGDSVILRNAGTSVKVEHNFSASLWQAGFGSVTIRVDAEDNANNTLSVEKELKGALGQLLDALAEVWAQFVAALQRAARAVAQAVNIIGKWVRMLIEDMMSPILGELTNALNSYLVEIVNGASLLIDEYNKTGQIDEDTFKVMENALLPGWLVGLAIGGILMALMITLISVTLGMSTLLSMAIGLVISLVVTEAFKINEKEGFLPSGIDENMGVKEIINFIGLYLGFIKRDVRVNDHYQEGIWSVFSLFFAWLSVQSGMNAFAMAEADGTGILSGTLAIAAGVLAFVVGLAALFAFGFTHNWGVMTFLGLVALFFSIEGVVFSALSLKDAGTEVAIIGVIGIALGFIGIYFSLKSLGVNIP